MASPVRERYKYMGWDLYSDDIESPESDPDHVSMRANAESELQEEVSRASSCTGMLFDLRARSESRCGCHRVRAVP
jgi:hypothetical protein